MSPPRNRCTFLWRSCFQIWLGGSIWFRTWTRNKLTADSWFQISDLWILIFDLWVQISDSESRDSHSDLRFQIFDFWSLIFDL
jgi:hypothetical protein